MKNTKYILYHLTITKWLHDKVFSHSFSIKELFIHRSFISIRLRFVHITNNVIYSAEKDWLS